MRNSNINRIEYLTRRHTDFTHVKDASFTSEHQKCGSRFIKNLRHRAPEIAARMENAGLESGARLAL